jgi:catechol 2,3-dioxygenase-like lactoylglutathione lyase family enzyme
MGIEHDAANAFPPAREVTPALASVQHLAAINTVHLPARSVSQPTLQHFYTHVLGLELVAATSEQITFRHGARRVVLGEPPPGADGKGLTLVVSSFGTLVQALSEARIPHEILHIDGGLSRMALIQDPAENWIRLLETRPL